MNRIVVGVDGSKGSQLALDWAVDEARLRGAQLCVLHAWHEQYMTGSPLAPTPVYTAAFEPLARQILDDMVEGIDTEGLAAPVERKLVQAGPATALLLEAEHADLLVLGTRGLGGFMGLLMGSVSSQVCHHATCPVVVVPEPK